MNSYIFLSVFKFFLETNYKFYFIRNRDIRPQQNIFCCYLDAHTFDEVVPTILNNDARMNHILEEQEVSYILIAKKGKKKKSMDRIKVCQGTKEIGVLL